MWLQQLFVYTKDPQSFRGAGIFCGSLFYGPLPHISVGDVIQQKYSINKQKKEVNMTGKKETSLKP